MLELRPISLFSSRYEVLSDHRKLGELTRAAWRNRADLVIGSETLLLRATGILKQQYQILDGGTILAEATQPSAWSSSLVLAHGGDSLSIRPRTWYGTDYEVQHHGKVVGTIYQRGLLRSWAMIDLPDSMPETLSVFIGWIVLVRWSQGRSAAAGT